MQVTAQFKDQKLVKLIRKMLGRDVIKSEDEGRCPVSKGELTGSHVTARSLARSIRCAGFWGVHVIAIRLVATYGKIENIPRGNGTPKCSDVAATAERRTLLHFTSV